MLPLDGAMQNCAGTIQGKIFCSKRQLLWKCFIFFNELVTVFSLLATRVVNELILHSNISLYKGHKGRFRSEARGGNTILPDIPLKLN